MSQNTAAEPRFATLVIHIDHPEAAYAELVKQSDEGHANALEEFGSENGVERMQAIRPGLDRAAYAAYMLDVALSALSDRISEGNAIEDPQQAIAHIDPSITPICYEDGDGVKLSIHLVPLEYSPLRKG